jgi:hypothetical protein
VSLALTMALAAVPAVAVAQSSTLPGEFAFRTKKGYYLTAINGGGRSMAPTIITAATSAGPWEKFRIVVADPAVTAFDKSFQTATGNYVTAVNGGGMTSDALHTDATQVRGWEQFRMNNLSVEHVAATYYELYTIGGRDVTAVGAGGHYEDAIHTDAVHVDTWEEFRPVKCGDLGSGYDYYIIPSVVPADGWALSAPGGGGRVSGAVAPGYGGLPESSFKPILQPDGSYALRTSNGVNFVTALGGGGRCRFMNTATRAFQVRASTGSATSSTPMQRRFKGGRNSVSPTWATASTRYRPSAVFSSVNHCCPVNKRTNSIG